MVFYVVQKIESSSSNVPDSEGHMGPISGVVVADSPEVAATLLGGKFQGKTKAGYGWTVHIPQERLTPPDPSCKEGDILYQLSRYTIGDIKISTRRGSGGITLHLTSTPAIASFK